MLKETPRLRNADTEVVKDFGEEWLRFDQRELSDAERQERLDEYFSVFPWEQLPPSPTGFDAGCGTGRWAILVAPRVGHLHCIDPSSAIDIAKQSLRHVHNCSFHRATVNDIPLADGSMDFGYSLGVLHHVPDTPSGLAACVRKLRSGAPFLVYLYYAFDNQPRWYRAIWRVSDVLRRGICTLPYRLRYVLSQLLALGIYLPLARTAKVLEGLDVGVQSFPLSAYRDWSFYSMRTDALDRFGTRVEKRFTKAQIRSMMENAGLKNIQFSQSVPFWCASGIKK